jgi:peptidyl-prolyl cis-trans isomerase B (cyclophilin B)
MIGHRTNPVGIRHRSAAELLYEKRHGAPGYWRVAPDSDEFPGAVHSKAVPSQDKRLRKKENARLAREARIAAEKRRRRLRSVRNAAIAIALFVLIIVIVNLFNGKDKKSASPASSTTTPTTTANVKVSAADFKVDPKKTYTASVATNLGTIELSLDTKQAPVAAGHFIKLARSGVYDGSRWHRIVKDYVIQGGSPGGDPSKDYGKSVVGEVPKNHYPVGSLAAAKTGPDPAGTFDSQFFIVTGAQRGETLPNDYARFGAVKSGMDVVKKIEALPTDSQEAPTQKATIDKVTITES